MLLVNNETATNYKGFSYTRILIINERQCNHGPPALPWRRRLLNFNLTATYLRLSSLIIIIICVTVCFFFFFFHIWRNKYVLGVNQNYCYILLCPPCMGNSNVFCNNVRCVRGRECVCVCAMILKLEFLSLFFFIIFLLFKNNITKNSSYDMCEHFRSEETFVISVKSYN